MDTYRLIRQPLPLAIKAQGTGRTIGAVALFSRRAGTRGNAAIRRLRDQRRIDVRGQPPNADAQHAVHDVVGQGTEIVQAEHVTYSCSTTVNRSMRSSAAGRWRATADCRPRRKPSFCAGVGSTNQPSPAALASR